MNRIGKTIMIHKIAAMIVRIQFVHCQTLLSRDYALVCDACKCGGGVEDHPVRTWLPMLML